MCRTVLAAIAFMGLASSSLAQTNLSTDELARRTIERRGGGGDLGHAAGQH
jgi:hypothetical protein